MLENLSALTPKERETIRTRAGFSNEELVVFNNLCSCNNRKDNVGLMLELNVSKTRLIDIKARMFFKVFRAAAAGKE